ARPTAALSAAGRRPSGSAAAPSARPGGRSRSTARPRCARRHRGASPPPPCPSARSTPARPPPVPPVCPSWTRCSAAGSVPGAVVLLAGEPGVGKSTLLLDVAAKSASDEHRTLYVTGEESASQVRLRADRINAIDDHLYLAAETDLAAVLGHLDAVKPSLLIL